MADDSAPIYLCFTDFGQYEGTTEPHVATFSLRTMLKVAWREREFLHVSDDLIMQRWEAGELTGQWAKRGRYTYA